VSCLAPHIGWRNISVAEPLRAHFGIPVYLENDARTLTIAEQRFGAGREINHFVTVVIGYGIGSGLVTNKQLYCGASGGAGEFGHIVFKKDGPLCFCGNRGCLESLTSIPAVNRMIRGGLASGEPSVLAGKEPLTVETVA
jgi:predicted NBD/HSP70 family sugar kinase